MKRLFLLIVYLFLAWHIPPSLSNAWYDETHVAMAKAAGYPKWFNSAGPDMIRVKMGGDKTFNEETLPVESVGEYFEHFPLLEIDYTFYRLLLEKDGKPTQNFHVLKSYRQQMKDGDFVLLKAPQIIIAGKLRFKSFTY